MIVPGCSMEYRALKTPASTVLCWARLKGSPSGCPKGHLRKTVLGGFTLSVYFLTIDIPMVDMPERSIALCISPTDWLHVPQAGVSNTASIPAAFSLFATSGAVLSTRVPIWGPSMWPIKP